MKPLNAEKALVRPTKSYHTETDEAESVLFLGTCLASANASADPTSHIILRAASCSYEAQSIPSQTLQDEVMLSRNCDEAH